MKKTQYYNLFKPDGTDAVDIQNFNDNFDAIDEALHDAADASGDLSKGAVYANVATSRTQIESGNTLGTIVGKIMKWFVDIKDAAFAQIANNDATTSSGYVLDARVGKEHGDEIDKLNTQMGGLYLGQNASGKWGYKTSPTGAVNPFRNPAGNAGTGDVLAGKTFANASSDSLTGTMPNNGSMTATLTPTGNNTTTKTIPAGYTTGGTITADGRTAYSAGYSAGLGTFWPVASVGQLAYFDSNSSGTMTATLSAKGKYILMAGGMYRDASQSGASGGVTIHALGSFGFGDSSTTIRVYAVETTSAGSTVSFSVTGTSHTMSAYVWGVRLNA